MLFALAILLFTTLTSVGLLALWAATSRRHWFVRTTAFLLAVSPVLLIPAYEPFVAFVTQGAVVAAGVWVARWRERRKRGERSAVRVSLKSVLLLTPLVAVLCAVGVRLPESVSGLDAWSWLSVFLIGATSGVISLLAFWVVRGKRLRWWSRAAGAALLGAIASSSLIFGDLVFVPAIDTFSFLATGDIFGDLMQVLAGSNSNFVWLPVQALSGTAIAALAYLFSFSRAPSVHWDSKRAFAKALACLTVLVLAVMPTCVLYELTHPLPIPHQAIPSPNGYDDFIAATEALPSKTPLIDTWEYGPATVPLDELKSAVEEVSSALAHARRGMRKENWLTVDYDSLERFDQQIQVAVKLRQVSRGFEAEAVLEEREGSVDAAASVYLDGIEYGSRIARGGLMVRALVGIAVTGWHCNCLYQLRERVSGGARMDAVDRLCAAEDQCESPEVILYRDRAWSQRVFGGPGHLAETLDSLGGSTWLDSEEVFLKAHKRQLVELRLLRVDFALHVYRDQHGDWPGRLEQLTPTILASIPTDPYARDGSPLRYQRKGESYWLYSVSEDGVEDGGTPAGEGESQFMGISMSMPDYSVGDMRVDLLFPPEPEPEEDEEIDFDEEFTFDWDEDDEEE